MSSITSLLKRLSRASEQLFPRSRETRLPYVCLDPATGAALLGYEEHNIEYQQTCISSILTVMGKSHESESTAKAS